MKTTLVASTSPLYYLGVAGYYLLLMTFISWQVVGVLSESAQVVDHGYTVAQFEQKQKSLQQRLQAAQLKKARALSLTTNQTGQFQHEFIPQQKGLISTEVASR